MSSNSPLPILLTIKFSHYNEFARWSLQHCKIDFLENGFAPVQHVPAVSKATKGITEKIFFSDSNFYNPNKEKNTSTGTPVMILKDKTNHRILADSWAIAEYAFTTSGRHKPLFIRPDVIQLGRILNEQVGPCVRTITYSYVLSPKNKNVFFGMCTDGAKGSWPVLMNLGLGGILTIMLRKGFHADDTEFVEKNRTQLKSIVKQIEQDWIVHRKTRYLIDDEISMFDLALAALMAPLLNAPLYNLDAHKKWLDLLYEQDEEIRKEMDYWRSTAVGQYCLELYEKNRIPSSSL